MGTYQLIPYGSSVNGLLDGDTKQGDLDVSLVVEPDSLPAEQVEPF